jgi:DNA-binding XRE family transcriptional regulator
MEPQLLKRVRRRLHMTQAGLAKRMGISAKAVQSYEQGWRRLPAPLASHVLLLLALHREQNLRHRPCWKVRACPEKTRVQCPSFKVSGGRYCWLVSGRMCAGRSSDDGVQLSSRCVQCPVVERLLQCRLDREMRDPERSVSS